MAEQPITVTTLPRVDSDGLIHDPSSYCQRGACRPLQEGDIFTGQCPDCLHDDGEGVYEYDDEFPAYEFSECDTCDGSGRVTGPVTRIVPVWNRRFTDTAIKPPDHYQIHGEWKPADG